MPRKAILAGLVGSALALGAPGAQAGSDSQFRGGCSLTPVAEDPRHPGRWIGEIDIETVVYSPTPGGNPVEASVRCFVAVDGVPQPGTEVTASGTGTVVGAGLIAYERDAALDDIVLCERIDFTGPGDTTPTVDNCPLWEVDPGYCPTFATLQGSYGPVLVTERGDIYVAGEQWYTCPPW